MDFREMLYITTVADCRSITAAARKLYISQPSLQATSYQGGAECGGEAV